MQITLYKRCSKCDSLNDYKYTSKQVGHRGLNFIECKACGHQKLESIFTVSKTEDDLVLKAAPIPEEEVY